MNYACRHALFICFFFATASVAQADSFHYFIGCDESRQIYEIRERTGAIGRGTPEYNDVARVTNALRCTMDTEYEVFASCNEDKTADIKIQTHFGDHVDQSLENERWTRCERARPPIAVAPPVTPEYSCEYISRATPTSPVANKYLITFKVPTFPQNVTLGEENKLVTNGIPMGNYYLHYVCNKNAAENPTVTSVSFKYAPGTRARTEIQITGGGTYPQVRNCAIHRGQKVAIGLVDCKKYKNHATILTPQALNEKTRKYAAECAGSGPSDPNACAALRRELNENAPDFAMICFQNNQGITQAEKDEQKRLTDTACGVCPTGQEMQFGRCVRTPHSPVSDASDGPAGCAKKNGFWHAGSAYCEVCSSARVPGERGCIEPANAQTPTQLPYCSPTFYYNPTDCRCNGDEEKTSGQYGDVICKKKNTSRDFTPPTESEKKYPPGTECQKRGTTERGVIAADGVTCTQTVSTHCLTACNVQTQQCVNGQCVQKNIETKTPPPSPASPCQPDKQPCTPPQNRPPSGPGNQTGGERPAGQQGQNGKQDPLSQLAKQMAQKGQGSQGQQGVQQQQDPSLMQRLMQMFQPKAFTTPFDNQPVEPIVCDSFEIDVPQTTAGLYRIKKGETIEVTWSVSGAKRVTVDTTPRTSTKYDGNIGDATSATITPSRTGTLTLRLKVDGNLYTKDPCRAKKIRVR